MTYNRNKVSEFAKLQCGGKTFVGVWDPVELHFIAGELVSVGDGGRVIPIGLPLETKSDVIKAISQKAIEYLGCAQSVSFTQL